MAVLFYLINKHELLFATNSTIIQPLCTLLKSSCDI